MNRNPLVIINNEKIFKEKNNFFCENLNLKVLPEGLNNYHKVHYIARDSKKKGYHEINLKEVKAASNIFKYIYFILKTFKIPNVNYLLISVTPYTFFAFLILFIFKKKMFVYLISNGYEEYRYILGRWFVWIYHIMYVVVTSNSKVIVCHERLFTKKKYHLIFPSRLDNLWLQNHKKASLDKIRLLYVGRLNPEKGIYEFLKMFGKIELNAELSIVGNVKKAKISTKNVHLLGYVSDPQSLINIYDDHNIMILPSFTEAHPYVVDESLSRKRPVIIFEDITYIVKDKRGIFISKRNINSFSETVKYIMQNYYEIQGTIGQNKLPTKNDMLKKISDIVSS